MPSWCFACSDGDIGYYFPDTDEENKNLSSEIIEKALGLLKIKVCSQKYDVIKGAPRIGPYADQKNLLEKFWVLKKALLVLKSTTEKMGVIGDGNGIAVYNCIFRNFFMNILWTNDDGYEALE